VNEAQPRFIWLPFTRKYVKDEKALYDRPVKGELLGPDSIMQIMFIRYNGVLERELSDTVQLMIRETSLVEGSVMNRSFNIVLKGRPQSQFQWAGPMIAYGAKGNGIDPYESKDIDMLDLRHLVDELNMRTHLVSHEHLRFLVKDLLRGRRMRALPSPAKMSSLPDILVWTAT
jgi:hypothetical protein